MNSRILWSLLGTGRVAEGSNENSRGSAVRSNVVLDIVGVVILVIVVAVLVSSERTALHHLIEIHILLVVLVVGAKVHSLFGEALVLTVFFISIVIVSVLVVVVAIRIAVGILVVLASVFTALLGTAVEFYCGMIGQAGG